MPPADNHSQNSDPIIPAFMEAANTSDPVSPAPSSSPPSPPLTPIESSGNKRRNKKTLLAITGILMLILGVFTSVYLVRRQQLLTTQAWDCAKYVFKVSRTGEITVSLDPNYPKSAEPAQSAVVLINGNPITTINVPNISKGQTLSLGKVTVPTDQGFTWEIQGQSECRNSGYHQPQISCPPIEVKPNSGDWSMTDKFTYTNNTAQPITIDWQIACQHEINSESCKKLGLEDESGTETLTPGQSVSRGFGAICIAWQLKLNFPNDNCPEVSYPVHPQNCELTKKPPTPTPSPTPTPPPNKCNGTCGSDANCEPNLTCYMGFCRNPNNPTSSTCADKPGATPTKSPTPTPIKSIPDSGASEYTLLVLIAAGSLLAVGFAFSRKLS